MLLARVDSTGSVREVAMTGHAATFDVSDGAMILDVIDAPDLEDDLKRDKQKHRRLAPGQLRIDIDKRLKAKARKLRRRRQDARHRTDHTAR